MDLVEILSSAIEDECAAQRKYEEGLAKAEEPQTKMVFRQLLEDEKRHETILRERLNAMKQIQGET